MSCERDNAAVTAPVLGCILNFGFSCSCRNEYTISPFNPSSMSVATTRTMFFSGWVPIDTRARKGYSSNTGALSFTSLTRISTGIVLLLASYLPLSVATTRNLYELCRSRSKGLRTDQFSYPKEFCSRRGKRREGKEKC